MHRLDTKHNVSDETQKRTYKPYRLTQSDIFHTLIVGIEPSMFAWETIIMQHHYLHFEYRLALNNKIVLSD